MMQDLKTIYKSLTIDINIVRTRAKIVSVKSLSIKGNDIDLKQPSIYGPNNCLYTPYQNRLYSQNDNKSLIILMKQGRILILRFVRQNMFYKYQVMGVCQPEAQKAEFTAYFSANLRQLYDSYKALLEYLKPSKLFAQTSQELNLLVETYLANPKIIDKENLGICSIDSVHKLHPIDYGTNKATKQWLINACLRQNKFIQEFPYQLLNFEQCYRHYVQFLYLCFKNPNSVIVPNKLADFMWHSHMQDNEKYKEDSKKMLKRVLNHTDDFTEEQMKIFAQQTEKTRKRLLRQPPKKANTIEKESSSSSYHNFVFINYGGGMCGGGYYPIDNHDIHPHPHPPHPHDNTHPHHPDHHHDTHPHHNDHHHHDTNPSNDTGGHHHSNCGGGHSSCGGGGSSCGGGGSSCGGGGSSCGGGGSSCGGGD